MAVTSNKVVSAMTLKYKTGVNTSGKDVFKSQKFSTIKLDAADDNLYAVAQALGGLLNYPVAEVQRQDQNTILGA